MADKKNPLGPTGMDVARNLKRIREEMHLTYAQLSRALTEIGRPIATLGLSRIETYERRVDVDDLLALAVVLDVSPVTLLIPNLESRKDRAPMTALGDVTAEEAWQFFEGFRSPRGTKSLEFVMRSRPQQGNFGTLTPRTASIPDLQYERQIRTNDPVPDVRTTVGLLDDWDDDGDD